MTTHRTTCPLDCPDACGMLAQTDATGALVSLKGNPEHPYSAGHLCGKTAIFRDVQDSPERLLEPLVREAGRLVPATWDDALARIADRVRPLAPERILSLGYAGNMGRLARKYPERVMHALGATMHDGGICDGEALRGHELVFGKAIGCELTQLDRAPGLLVWGCDLARTVQHSLPRVRALCRDGKPVVVVDVYRSDTVRRVERWGGRGVIVKPGTDAGLLLALARHAFEVGAVDRAARAADCHGLQEFEAAVQTAPDLDEAAQLCGIDVDEVQLLHRLLAEQRVWTKAGIGWARRFRGANAMRALCSLVAIHGLEDAFHFESFDCFPEHTEAVTRPDLRPAGAPLRVVEHVGLGARLDAGDYGAVFVWGHNPAVTLPNEQAVRRGLAREDCFVVVHELFLTETAALADVVLPAASFLEQRDLFTSYGHRCVQHARVVVEPPGEACGNVETFRRIARALELPDEVWSADVDQLADDLLERFGASLDDGARERLASGEPTELHAVAGSSRATPSDKLELASDRAVAAGGSRLPDWSDGDPPGERGAFQLHCAPSIHTHNSTYLHSPRHLARVGRPGCALNPTDASDAGVTDGDSVQLSNERASLTLEARVSEDVPPGMIVVDGLFRPEDTPEGLGLNALTTARAGDLGRGNSYYSTRVDLARVNRPATRG